MKTSLMFSCGVVGIMALAASCTGDAGGPGGPVTPRLHTVRLWPSDDVVTAASADGTFEEAPISVLVGNGGTAESFAERELPAWNGNVRVVSWPARQTVDGEWVLSDTETAGTVIFTFAPNGAIPAGWYALQVNFDAINEARDADPAYEWGLQGMVRSTVVDGWTTRRFHVGSRPIVRLAGTVNAEGEARAADADLDVSLSEVVSFGSEFDLAEAFTVSANGVEVDCENPFGESSSSMVGPDRTVTHFYLRCDDAPRDAEVRITMNADLLAAAGVELFDIHGNSPPLWNFPVSGAAEGSGEPGDALFADRAEESP